MLSGTASPYATAGSSLMRANRSRGRKATAAAKAQVDRLERKCRELEEDGELLRSRLEVLPTAIAAVEEHIHWALAARVALSPACIALLRAQRTTQVRVGKTVPTG